MQVAIIGMGGMGRRHLEAVLKDGMNVSAVCDYYKEAAQSAVAECDPCPAVFSDWKALLDHGGFDVLIVATNGPSHHEIVLAAAEARIPYVLCEKPLSTSGSKCREMVEACARTGTSLGVNLARRFMPTSQALKTALTNGTIGRVRHFNFHIGAGGLGCIGTHYFDMPAWLLDTRPEWVSGIIDENPAPNVRGEQFLDPGGRAMVGYANGATASFECSGDVSRMSRGEIIGTHGHVIFDDLGPNGMTVSIHARPKEAWDEPSNRYFKPEEVLPAIEPGPFEVVDSSLGCLHDLLDGGDTATGGLDAVDVVMAIHLSARKGGWVRIDLPLTNDDLLPDIPIT